MVKNIPRNLEKLELPRIIRRPIRTIRMGQNLKIYTHTPQSTTPIELRSNIPPTRIKNTALE